LALVSRYQGVLGYSRIANKLRFARIAYKRAFLLMDEMISSMRKDLCMAQDPLLPPLSALQAFHAAGIAESFQAAARALSVTPSAISHQVRTLEHWLGKPMFTRQVRQVRLTPEGHAFLRVVGRSFHRIRAAADRMRVNDTGLVTLRISALPLFTSAWLIPRLVAFERDHPNILLDIDTTNRVIDFGREALDLAIRNVAGPTSGLQYRKLLDIRPVPLSTRQLRDQLSVPADLARQTLIHVSARQGGWARWLAAVGCEGLRAKRDLIFDSVPAALEAAARGRGVALGMDPISWDTPVAEYPFAEGRLAG
jgi:LysR family glycine cleavage system transcriptional activator